MTKQFLSEFVSVDDDFIKGIASKASSYEKLFEDGSLSKEEYLELLKDLQSQKVIAADANKLAEKEALNQALNGLITAASLI